MVYLFCNKWLTDNKFYFSQTEMFVKLIINKGFPVVIPSSARLKGWDPFDLRKMMR